MCGAEREDWKHVLVECGLYEDLRDLPRMNVSVIENGVIDVSGVIVCEDSYKCIGEYAARVFKRRKERMND